MFRWTPPRMHVNKCKLQFTRRTTLPMQFTRWTSSPTKFTWRTNMFTWTPPRMHVNSYELVHQYSSPGGLVHLTVHLVDFSSPKISNEKSAGWTAVRLSSPWWISSLGELENRWTCTLNSRYIHVYSREFAAEFSGVQWSPVKFTKNKIKWTPPRIHVNSSEFAADSRRTRKNQGLCRVFGAPCTVQWLDICHCVS